MDNTSNYLNKHSLSVENCKIRCNEQMIIKKFYTIVKYSIFDVL